MVDGFWEHPDRARQKDIDDDDDENAGIKNTNMDVVNNWAVKLTFNRVGEAKPLDGNGFFLNVPGVEDRHIILTAAHNLMKDGNRSFNLKAIYNNPFEVDPADPSKVLYTYPINSPFVELAIDNIEPNTYICERYAAGSPDPSADYGVICIRRIIPGNGPSGFGFSLNLAFKKTFKGTVHVSGFKAPKGDAGSSPKKTLRPSTSSTSKMVNHDNHVEYWAETEPGISGSPVWVEYNQIIAAIAIHNQGVDTLKNPKAGSCGALLTVDLLTQVFKWISPTLLRTGVQLQARQPPPPKKKRGAPATAPVPNPFDRGLFLSFKNNASDIGRVRLGSGTKFDCIPAQVDAEGAVSYAFFVPSRKSWLKFDLGAKIFQNIKLSEKWNGRGCLLMHLQEKDSTWVELGIDTGVLDANNSPVRMQLRMQGAQIKPYDENRETAELSLVKNPSKDQFYRFILT